MMPLRSLACLLPLLLAAPSAALAPPVEGPDDFPLAVAFTYETQRGSGHVDVTVRFVGVVLGSSGALEVSMALADGCWETFSTGASCASPDASAREATVPVAPGAGGRFETEVTFRFPGVGWGAGCDLFRVAYDLRMDGGGWFYENAQEPICDASTAD